MSLIRGNIGAKVLEVEDNLNMLTLLVNQQGDGIIQTFAEVSDDKTISDWNCNVTVNAVNKDILIQMPSFRKVIDPQNDDQEVDVIGDFIQVKKMDESSNKVIILPPANSTIDGLSEFILHDMYDSVIIKSDGNGNCFVFTTSEFVHNGGDLTNE